MLASRWLTQPDERLELGGVVFEFKHRGGAHTPGDMLVGPNEREPRAIEAGHGVGECERAGQDAPRRGAGGEGEALAHEPATVVDHLHVGERHVRSQETGDQRRACA